MNGKNKITSQLLAAYAEGKVTPDERTSIRAYLAQHPELLEGVLYMIDKFDVECANSDACTPSTLFPDVSLYAAAFTPFETQSKTSHHFTCTSGIEDIGASFKNRLDSLLDF